MATIRDSVRTERLQARVNPETKDLIERAAFTKGISVSDFLITSAYDAATQTLAEHEIIQLNQRDSQLFFGAVAQPPAANEAFKKAARRYAELD